MYDKMYDMMKTTTRELQHDLANFLEQAHEGQEIVVTKRGKPWARIVPMAAEKPKKRKKLDWSKVFERTEENFKGRTVDAVSSYLKMREEARW